MNRRLWLATSLLALGASDPWADAATLDLHAYVRAVSLDVRGVVPTADELDTIEAAGELPDALLQEWLRSDGFTEGVVSRHRERFWNNLDISLLNERRLGQRSQIRFVNARANSLRGAAQAHCGDFEADVDSHNRPLSWVDNPDGTISEGWVEVVPYWDTEPLRVCALDAQTTAVTDAGVDCSTEAGQNDPDCGCGPNLQWCLITDVEEEIEAALEADIDARVRQMVDSDAPYSTLFTASSIWVDGASAHFFAHLAAFRPEGYGSPVDLADVADIPYTDRTLRAVALAQPDVHAGVLTAPGWLMRHQTNRGRANRFYGGFLCSEFLPTEADLTAGDTNALPTPDLQARAGCLDCHTRLEPWAAWWGRWAPAGAVYRPAETHPTFLEECEACALAGTRCSDLCDDLYVTEVSHEDQRAFVGMLATYSFLYDDNAAHPDEGPLAWVDETLADGTLAECAAESTASWLLDRPPSEDHLATWADAFSADEDIRSLVARVVTSNAYWEGVE